MGLMDIIVLIPSFSCRRSSRSLRWVLFRQRHETRALADTGSKQAEMAPPLRTDPALPMTILVGDRLVDTATASLATITFLNRFEGRGSRRAGRGLSVLVGILILFVPLRCFADRVPRPWRPNIPVPVVLNMAYPAYAAQQVLTPIMFFVVPLIFKLTGGKGLNVPSSRKKSSRSCWIRAARAARSGPGSEDDQERLSAQRTSRRKTA